MPIVFDVEGARQAGATDREISDYLSTQVDFDIDSARMQGASDQELVKFLTGKVGMLNERERQYDNLASEMSPVEKFAVGYGKTAADIGGAVKQAGMQIGEAVGLVDPQTNAKETQRIADDQARFEELRNRSPAALGGQITGIVANSIPLMAVPTGQGMAARSAIGGGVGAGSAMLEPTTNPNYLAGKAGQAAFGGTIGAAFPAVSGAVRMEPVKAIVSSIYRRALSKPSAAEGQLLSRELGDLFTPAELTGSKSLNILENVARQSVFTADEIFERDKKIMQAGKERVERFANQISRTNLSPEGVGTVVQDATKKTVRELIGLRSQVAANDYGIVRQLAGDQPVIQFNNAVRELRKIIDENSGVVSGDSKKIAKQAKEMLDELTNGGAESVILHVDKAMKNRSAWSRASKGAGNVFEEVSPSLNREMAARLAAAAGQDFKQTADNVASPDLKAALDFANKNYEKFSKSLEAVEKSALGRLVGDDVSEMVLSGQTFNTVAGESVASKILKLSPSETRAAFDILSKHSPEVIPVVKSYVVRNALEKATEGLHPNQVAQGVSMSFNAFMKALPDKRKMLALGFKPDELDEMKRITAAMLRTGDRSGFNASGTSVRQEAAQVVGALGGLLSGSIKGAATIGGQAIGVRQIAHAMTSKEGREALKTLSNPRATTKQIERAASLLTLQSEKVQGD